MEEPTNLSKPEVVELSETWRKWQSQGSRRVPDLTSQCMTPLITGRLPAIHTNGWKSEARYSSWNFAKWDAG